MPGLAPAGEILFFASPKKSTQKKGDPTVCDPLRCATGATCGARSGRGPHELAALRQHAALIRPALRSSAQTEGVRERNSRQPTAKNPTAQKTPAPSLRSAWCSAKRAQIRPSAAKARVDIWGALIPSDSAEERSGQRIRARDCLSAASLSETPLGASTAGCPKRSAGTQAVGSPFFWLLFFGEAKKSASPAGARPGTRPQQRAHDARKSRPSAKNLAPALPLADVTGLYLRPGRKRRRETERDNRSFCQKTSETTL